MYVGKRNYIVDVMLVGGNDLNMSYLPIPPLWRGFKMPEGEEKWQYFAFAILIRK